MEDPLEDSEIFHSGEGEDVERWLESRNKFSCVYVLLCLALYCFSFFIFVILFILHSIIAFISSFSLSVYTHLNKEVIEHLNSFSRGIKEEKF